MLQQCSKIPFTAWIPRPSGLRLDARLARLLPHHVQFSRGHFLFGALHSGHASMLDRNQAGDFTLDDFKKQLEQVKNIGMKDMLRQMPGMEGMIPAGEDPEVAMERVTKMIDAMTKEERQNPNLIGLSQRQRIASDSGTTPHEIETFLAQFEQVRVLMRQVAKMSLFERIKLMTGLGRAKHPEPTDEPDEPGNGK
jgi:signal recognition particle GTPase